jgi:all-trans-retinol 13,14-reductase
MRNLEPSTLRIGRRYRPSRLNVPYDALVIGSGIGGLTTAALLAELGWRVAVLEQHYTAGGATHSYDRAGYEWDVGVHYLGDMGAQTTVRRLMDFLTQGNLAWAPMDAHYDRFFIGDNVYDAVAGREAFRDNLVSHFPREAPAIDRYLELLGEVSRGMRTFTLDRTLPPWAAAVAGPLLRSRLPKSFDRTTWEVLSELTQDPELIAVLTGQWGDMGLPPKRSSFVIQALIAKHYLHGGFYPVGGAWRIADTIIPRIRATGGEVFTYARVKEILVRDGRACGVRMEDGHEIESRCVISDAGAINTFARLLPGETARAHGYEALLPKVKPSIGHLGVYISRPRPPSSACRRRTSGSTRTTTTTARSRSSRPTRAGRSRSCISRSRRRRTPTSSGGIRGGPRSKSLRPRRTRFSRPGPTRPGASAATTTSR